MGNKRSQPKHTSLHPWIWLLPAGMLVAAIIALPYGYYQLLRLVVFVAATFLAFRNYQETMGVSHWVIAFSLLALLFNPIVPIYLDRAIWMPIDLLAAVVFVANWRTSKQQSTDG